MVGVSSMCPPHPFSHFPTSRHPCGPTFLPTWPLHSLCTTSHTLLCTSAHLCTPLCFTFPGLVTLIQLSSDLGPPSSYHRQPSPSATGHSAHSRPLYNQVQPLQPPCGPSAFPVGLHNCHGMTSLLSFLVFVCPLPHLHHLPTPSNLIHLPSTASTPTLRCTRATMLHPHLIPAPRGTVYILPIICLILSSLSITGNCLLV